MKEYKKLKATLLKDSVIQKEYSNLESQYVIAEQLIKKRLKQGMTQKDLAIRVKTKQSAIARLESGNYNPSFLFLSKVVKELGGTLKIKIS